MRAELFKVPVDILTIDETVGLVESAVRTRGRLQHVALNVAKLVSLQNNDELREDVASSDIVGVDGMGIALALRFLGHKNVGRVSGVDLMMKILAFCAMNNHRPFFLGATEEIMLGAVAVSKQKFPGLQFAGFENGYFNSEEEAKVMGRIAKSGADCLFIGMPTPRKERLLKKWRDELNIPFIMGVGGSFDVLAGKVQRAPLWMQTYGLEWTYRIYQEPGRMWWRYLSTNTRFLGMLAQLISLRLFALRRFFGG